MSKANWKCAPKMNNNNKYEQGKWTCLQCIFMRVKPSGRSASRHAPTLETQEPQRYTSRFSSLQHFRWFPVSTWELVALNLQFDTTRCERKCRIKVIATNWIDRPACDLLFFGLCYITQCIKYQKRPTLQKIKSRWGGDTTVQLFLFGRVTKTHFSSIWHETLKRHFSLCICYVLICGNPERHHVIIVSFLNTERITSTETPCVCCFQKNGDRSGDTCNSSGPYVAWKTAACRAFSRQSYSSRISARAVSKMPNTSSWHWRKTRTSHETCCVHNLRSVVIGDTSSVASIRSLHARDSSAACSSLPVLVQSNKVPDVVLPHSSKFVSGNDRWSVQGCLFLVDGGSLSASSFGDGWHAPQKHTLTGQSVWTQSTPNCRSQHCCSDIPDLFASSCCLLKSAPRCFVPDDKRNLFLHQCDPCCAHVAEIWASSFDVSLCH